MAFWFDLEKPIDDSVFEAATYHYTYVMHLPVSPDEVWAGLVADKPLAWCKMLNGQYTSSRPFGVGTTRAVGVAFKALKLRERFFIWDDERRRHAFYVEQMNVPFFAMFAEDYQVKPTSEGSEFTWRFAFEPRKGFKLFLDLVEVPNKLVLFDGFKRDTEKHFKKK